MVLKSLNHPHVQFYPNGLMIICIWDYQKYECTLSALFEKHIVPLWTIYSLEKAKCPNSHYCFRVLKVVFRIKYFLLVINGNVFLLMFDFVLHWRGTLWRFFIDSYNILYCIFIPSASNMRPSYLHLEKNIMFLNH